MTDWSCKKEIGVMLAGAGEKRDASRVGTKGTKPSLGRRGPLTNSVS